MKGYTPKLIKEELDSVHGDNAPSDYTVKSWVKQFKMGRTSTEDEQRPGRPKTATTTCLILTHHIIFFDTSKCDSFFFFCIIMFYFILF